MIIFSCSKIKNFIKKEEILYGRFIIRRYSDYCAAMLPCLCFIETGGILNVERYDIIFAVFGIRKAVCNNYQKVT